MSTKPRAEVPDLGLAFKQAMRRLASTVTIVSARRDGIRYGMAATAVTSVTTAPPTLLVCVNQSASIHDPIRDSGWFCVNLLGHEHERLVPIFSGKALPEDRYAHGRWGEDATTGLPYLEDGQASLFCAVTALMPYHSHSVIIGEVREVRLFGITRPLVYQEGGLFRTVQLNPDEA